MRKQLTDSAKRRLLVIGPVPPPHHGVTTSTALVLASKSLHERFDVQHLDTSDRRALRTIGKWDLQNVGGALLSVMRLARALGGRRGVVYLPLSQTVGGFVRDALFIRLAAVRGWAVAAHLRGSEFDELYTAQAAPMRWWIRDTLRHVDSMAIMGDSLRRTFNGLIPPERLAVVPNGTLAPNLDGGSRDPHTGLFLSNLFRRKGVIEGLRAASLVTEGEPSARFMFVGEWEDDDLEREAHALAAGAGGQIEFRPATFGAAKDALLARSGFLLFPPSRPEGHPRVVLEALAAGLPVITTNRGAIAETVVDGESGFVLDHPDPTRLAECMLALIRDPELWARMSAAARQRYLDFYTQERAERRLVEWLETVRRYAEDRHD